MFFFFFGLLFLFSWDFTAEYHMGSFINNDVILSYFLKSQLGFTSISALTTEASVNTKGREMFTVYCQCRPMLEKVLSALCMCVFRGVSHCSELWVHKSDCPPRALSVCSLLWSWHMQSPLQGPVKFLLRSLSTTRKHPLRNHLKILILHHISEWNLLCFIYHFHGALYVTGFSFLSSKHCESSHSLIISMQIKCALNCPWVKTLVSAIWLNNLN